MGLKPPSYKRIYQLNAICGCLSQLIKNAMILGG